MPPNPRGALLYLHGIQSHGHWFENSASRLADAGFAVLLPDRRGSGRNSVDRGHTPSARRLLRDLTESMDELHVRTGFDRCQVVGVSWGGKLALALQRHVPQRVASLALVAPGLFPVVDISLMQKVRVGLSAFTMGKALFDIPLNDPELFTGNPERQSFIRDDDLKLTRVSASFLAASRLLERFALGARRDRTGCPLRLYLAQNDRIIDNERTREFVRNLSWPGRDIVEYPNSDHTLEFDVDPETYFNDLVQWHESVCPAPV
jgi:pimeloyl-ACP methyl ester carboxylesterase